MDFAAQFWATMWGALAGAVVAGTLSWWVATSTLKAQAKQRYEDNLDAALGTLFAAISQHIAEMERWVRSGMNDPALAPSTWRLQIDVDAAWMVARTKEDAVVMTFVGKALYTVPRTELEWRKRELPIFVENIRSWRTGESTAAALITYLDDFANRADTNTQLKR